MARKKKNSKEDIDGKEGQDKVVAQGTDETVSTEDVVEASPQAIAEGVVPPDMYTEQAFVSIAPIGEGELLYETFTDTIDMELPEKPVDFIPTLAGGRLDKFTPAGDGSVTLDIYPVEAGTDGWPAAGESKTATGIVDLMQSEVEATTSQHLSYQIDSLTRQKVRLTVLLTSLSSVGSGAALTSITTSEGTALRFSFADGYVTKITPSMSPSDGLKFSVELKFPATDKDANECTDVDSCDMLKPLTALNNYTTTTKF